jgi:hypothetical protein
MVAVPESALAAAPEVIRMRGYTLDKKDQAILKVSGARRDPEPKLLLDGTYQAQLSQATSGSTVVNE